MPYPSDWLERLIPEMCQVGTLHTHSLPVREYICVFLHKLLVILIFNRCTATDVMHSSSKVAKTANNYVIIVCTEFSAAFGNGLCHYDRG